MVKRPESSSTRSDKSSSSSSKSMYKPSVRAGGANAANLIRSKSGNDYMTNNKLRNSSSMQSIASKSSEKGTRSSLRKFKSSGR